MRVVVCHQPQWFIARQLVEQGVVDQVRRWREHGADQWRSFRIEQHAVPGLPNPNREDRVHQHRASDDEPDCADRLITVLAGNRHRHIKHIFVACRVKAE